MRRAFDDLPPVKGGLKTVPEDFVVEEICEGRPDGEGPHLLLWVEKRGRDTQQVVKALASALRAPIREIGVAGQKDRQAVTRQWISVPAHKLNYRGEASELPSGDGWKVLAASPHGSKLRTGRLAGNRFRIRVRGGAPQAESARIALGRLARMGVPNYFGSQRFGRGRDNAEQGRQILEGSSRIGSRFERRMYLSALQSALFNEWLDRRFDDGLLNEAVAGDLLRERPGLKDPFRGEDLLQPCVNPEKDRPAVSSGLLDPTGPIFGSRMRECREEAEERERQVLEDAGLSMESFLAVEKEAPGSRRPARARLEAPEAVAEGEDLLLAFDLERGCYATVVLSQLGLGL